MANKPEFKRVGASIYACTVCAHFQVEISRRLNPGELQRHLEMRLAQHIRQYHPELSGK
jgi:hypothetical protein